MYSRTEAHHLKGRKKNKTWYLAWQPTTVTEAQSLKTDETSRTAGVQCPNQCNTCHEYYETVAKVALRVPSIGTSEMVRNPIRRSPVPSHTAGIKSQIAQKVYAPPTRTLLTGMWTVVSIIALATAWSGETKGANALSLTM